MQQKIIYKGGPLDGIEVVVEGELPEVIEFDDISGNIVRYKKKSDSVYVLEENS